MGQRFGQFSRPLACFGVQTSIYHSDHSLIGEQFHYARHREEFQRLIANVRLHIIAGARFCMSWERATDIAGHARTFLA